MEQKGVKSNCFGEDLFEISNISFTSQFLEKIIPKDKKLFLGIKSGAEGSKIELFWGGFV